MRTSQRILSLSMLAVLSGGICGSSWAQTPDPTFPVNGTYDKALVATVLEHATVHLDATTTVNDGTVVLHRGRIVAAGPSATTSFAGPAVRLDMTGLHLYPSFVDIHSDFGTPEVQRAGWSRTPQHLSDKKGAYGWNEAVRPETSAAEEFDPSEDAARELRKAGFGAVLTHVQDGVVRGTGAVVLPLDDPREALLAPDASFHMSFRKGSSSQNYPSSLMGATALLRQTHLDAQWYAEAAPRGMTGGTNLSLEAFVEASALPRVFSAGSWKDVLRADAVLDEFGVTDVVMLGSGDGYQRAEALAATGARMAIPVDYPAGYDVSDPHLARMIGLDELKHWELAPSNASRLHKAGVPLAFTAHGLSDVSEFLAGVRKAVDEGLPEEEALKALTSNPATWLGLQKDLGSLRAGRVANVLVTDGPLFESGTHLVEHWVAGQPTPMRDRHPLDLAGTYNVNVDDSVYVVAVKGEPGKWKASWTVNDSTDVKVPLTLDNRTVVLRLATNDGPIRLTGNVWMESRIWEGTGQTADGSWADWSAIRNADEAEQAPDSDPDVTADDDASEAPEEIAEAAEAPVAKAGLDLTGVVYPFTAYGTSERLDAETVWIRNATVWTCEEEGVLQRADVLLHNGALVAIGQDLNPATMLPAGVTPVEIDGRGKHVTPGVIDEHTHIAVDRGVNEGTQASSAEVWIGHAVDSEDVNMYRQLSGGVTCAQILHGSANPIGGQSAIIKFRWGAEPQDLLYEEAVPFIKFALGENVKQSNWGDGYRSRFPQTRMGVEQVYYDHFIRAREYGLAQLEYRAAMRNAKRKDIREGRGPVAPRVDLELETLLQILNEERFVTCHSYRQDEINMLMHVADSMGFRLNTFTHILEGYKVADKMAEHGAGGSSFSDWWAYKYEVKDAIPYNGAVLHNQGVVTAFNSDDAEMARRLNQEAAKAYKYGRVPEEEALKFVTLNPAKLLHIDHKTGSLKPGKDADVVVWSDHPLSINAKAEQTFVEGVRCFDVDRDRELREAMRAERARLTAKMYADGESSGRGGKKRPSERIESHYHCDTLTDENR
ncbi:MAG: amidohydrolase family protein [Bacteroidetes bacterium]|nr:amidohydrolase family protein [Bacteroidota bacterium]